MTSDRPGQGIFARVIAGLASTSLSQFISAGQSILLVPLFLRAWGADGYGDWLTLTAFVSYIGLLDLGGQGYIGNLLAFDHTRGDEADLRRRLAEGVSLFSVISLVSFFLLAATLLYPSLPFPGRGVPMDWNGRGVLLLMGGAFLLSIPQGVFVQVYRATGLFVTGTMIGNGMRLSFLMGYAGILVAGLPPILFAAGHFAATVILTVTVVWYGYRRIPQCRGVQLSLSAAWAGRAYLGGAIFFWLIALADAVNFQGVIIVLGVLAAPGSVALYGTHRMASALLRYIGSLFMTVLWPEMTFLHARGETEKLRRLVLLGIRVVVFLSTAGAVLLWVFLPDIYPLWTARRLHLQPELLGLFLVQGVLATGWTAASWVLLASNQHRSLSYWALANAVVTILLGVIFAPRYGVMGVALATLAGDVIFGGAVYPWIAAHRLLLPVRKVYSAILLPALAVLSAGGLLFLGSRMVEGNGMRILTGCIIALVLAYPTVLLALGRTDLNWMMDLFRQQFARAEP